MLTNVFWISFVFGTAAAAVIAFRYSRSGSHPRFRPNRGLVAIVFVVILVINVFLSLLVSRIVGKPTPPLGNNNPVNPDAIRPSGESSTEPKPAASAAEEKTAEPTSPPAEP